VPEPERPRRKARDARGGVEALWSSPRLEKRTTDRRTKGWRQILEDRTVEQLGGADIIVLVVIGWAGWLWCLGLVEPPERPWWRAGPAPRWR
jgi:hypothetical protein